MISGLLLCVCFFGCGGTLPRLGSLMSFEMEDQFRNSHSHADFKGRVLVVIGSDREGASAAENWGKALSQSLKPERDSGRLNLVGLSNLKGVPFFLKDYVRGKFSQNPGDWALMDWKGLFAGSFGFIAGNANVLVFDKEGELAYQAHFSECRSDQVLSLTAIIRGKLDGPPPVLETGQADLPPPPAVPIRVLLLSGQNNHDWKTTTPKLQGILEEDGRFQVDITGSPGGLTSSSLEPYDAILSNWNAYGNEVSASAWPEEARRATLEFVRGGKGHIVVHAGSSSFEGWDDYARLTLAAWKNGRSSHGPIHEFPVRIDDPLHPVTAGLAPFTIRDELWNRPGTIEGAKVLASSFSAPDMEGTGEWEPAVLAGGYGKGRSLTILLGHDAEAMDNLGFRALLLRAVEWAARGRVSPREEAAEPSWRWQKTDGAALALVGAAGPLWRFNYDRGLDTPHFHPLTTPEGRTLTWDQPPDHIWHHGLWFSWKFINGVNYWEIDPKTGRPAGRASWTNVKIETGGGFGAKIAMDLAYRPAGEEAAVLTERRSIEISAPAPDGTYAMDWTCTFRAVREVVLDRTPIPGEPGGQSWGGYAGLSLRLTGDMTGRRAVTIDGPIAESEMREERYRGRHAALDYSGLVNGMPAGVAILDHPGNPRSPTPWYVIISAEMSFFSPALLCFEPMTLRPGEGLTLRYRVIVHPGRWDAARLDAEYRRFAR